MVRGGRAEGLFIRRAKRLLHRALRRFHRAEGILLRTLCRLDRAVRPEAAIRIGAFRLDVGTNGCRTAGIRTDRDVLSVYANRGLSRAGSRSLRAARGGLRTVGWLLRTHGYTAHAQRGFLGANRKLPRRTQRRLLRTARLLHRAFRGNFVRRAYTDRGNAGANRDLIPPGRTNRRPGRAPRMVVGAKSSLRRIGTLRG